MWRVTVIESERGWGQSVHDVRYFETIEEANSFVKDFNSRNTADKVPDWYLVALWPEFDAEHFSKK